MKIFLYNLLLFLPFLAQAQSTQTIITGRIMDSTRQPLEGAIIEVISTHNKTTTKSDGSFTVKVANIRDSIKVSYLNYEGRTVPVDVKAPIIIFLRFSVNQLEEITVNTGYQKISRERATGSYTLLDNKTLNLQVGTTTLSRLEGLTNGILFDRNSNRPAITIRGLSTIYGNQQPLVIVNHFPYEGDLNNINPDDVENISVLKDAAAASIWGTRAGNGVIVITLKKGKRNRSLQVNFNSVLTVADKPDLSYFKPIASSDFIDVEQMLYSKGFYTSQINNISRPALTPVVELLLKKTNGQLSPAEADSRINALRNLDVRNDFSKYLYSNLVNTQYSLSLQGGSPVVTYHVSGAMNRNTNELKATYNRVNLYADNSFKLSDALQLTTSLYYTQSRSGSGRSGYGQGSFNGQQLYPYAQLADAAGNPLALNVYREPYIDTAGNGKLLDWKYYPLDEYRRAVSSTNTQDILANAGLQYNLGKGLSFSANYQYQRQVRLTETLQDINSFSARDLINRFSQINRSTGVVKYIVPLGGIFNNTKAIMETQNARGQINYQKNWGKHDISLLAGGEIREIISTGNSSRVYGYNDEFATVGAVDLVNTYPTFITGANQAIPSGNAFSGKRNRFTSLLFNGAYTFRSRYMFSASARKDASNLFGVQANEKGVPLWSTGLSWSVSKEPFYSVPWLPMLKLRLTYGSSGNVDNNRSAVTTIGYTPIGAQYTNLPYANVTQFPNPSLRWEKVYLFNAGIDFATKASLFSGSVEFYSKKGVDLFGNAPVDYTTGLGTNYLTENIANMEGHGFDIQLHARPFSGQLKWTPTLVFNFAASKVTRFNQTATQGSAYLSSGESISPLEGKPVYSILSYQWAGLDPASGDPQGIVNGLVSKNYTALTGPSVLISDLVYRGSAVPVYWGNFLNSFVYKNWSVNINMVYKLGYYFRRSSINYSSLFSASSGHSDFAERWQLPGDEARTQVPSLIYPTTSARDNFYNSSYVLVEKGDHIRLQFINISYELQPKGSRSAFQKLQVYFNANNMGIIWKSNKKAIDPDYTSGLPPSKSYALGIRVNF
ncbi:MAG: SusC/RagA family TonB-linked outer membrane protein [Bacteroidetes bacterium]|nr:SusC/RagA family TonB-linked outer membrane protein [Bacteroidota bacterium]